MGGVMGLSLIGDPLLPESSVSPGPDKIVSDPLLVALMAVVRVLAGAELVGLSFVEKRFFVSAVVRADGADLRLGSEGGEWMELSMDACGGGLLREDWCRLRLENRDLSSCGDATADRFSFEFVQQDPDIAATCGYALLRKGTRTDSSMSSYVFATATSRIWGLGGSAEGVR